MQTPVVSSSFTIIGSETSRAIRAAFDSDLVRLSSFF